MRDSPALKRLRTWKIKLVCMKPFSIQVRVSSNNVKWPHSTWPLLLPTCMRTRFPMRWQTEFICKNNSRSCMVSNQISQIPHCKIWPLISIWCMHSNSYKGPTYFLSVSSNSLLLISSNSLLKINRIRLTFKIWAKKKERLLKSKKLESSLSQSKRKLKVS